MGEGCGEARLELLSSAQDQSLSGSRGHSHPQKGHANLPLRAALLDPEIPPEFSPSFLFSTLFAPSLSHHIFTMSETFQELADIPKDFVREGTLFIRRCTKRNVDHPRGPCSRF